MKPQGLRRLIIFLTLAFLLLTSCPCQLAALETTKQPAEPTGMAAQPLEANSDVPATEDTTHILGMNYETPKQLAMFEQVLDSFQSNH